MASRHSFFMKRCHKYANYSAKHQVNTELNRRLRALADEQRREKLTQLKNWVENKLSDAFVLLLLLFFLFLIVGSLFAISAFWFMLFSFIQKITIQFGTFGVIGVIFLLLLLNFYSSKK